MKFSEEIECVADIPEGWKWVKVRELLNSGVCELLDRYRIPLSDNQRSKMKDGILYPYYGANGVIDYINSYIFDGEFILVAEDGTVSTDKGKPVVQHVRGKFWVSNHAHVIKCENPITLKFLYYALKNADIIPYITGAVQPKLNQRSLLDIEILYALDIDEQKAIAEVLSSIDDKIELLHRQNKTLEEMVMTLFRQWFVEPIKDGLPDGWEEVSLGEFFPVITGKKNANFATDDGHYPFFTCSQEPLKAPSYSFDGNAILLAGNGDFNIKRYKGKFDAYQRTYVLIPYNPEYFNFLYLIMKFNLDEITGNFKGSVINYITKDMITDFKFSLPKDRSSIKDKLLYFDRIYDKVDANTSQIQTLEKLRDTLLPKLMSGEIRAEI